jgi:serine/threonine-protein kinase 11
MSISNEYFILLPGTPAFQCPEIANGEDTYSGYSIDIWSCGVTLYNLVTGHLPFEADNIYLLFQTIGKGVYIIPNDIEPQLTSLIHGLLHIDKNLRFKLEQIKQHDWFRRRPSRTFEYVPFPHLALNRFQTFTMLDYLTELHQSTSLSENNNNNHHHHQEDEVQPNIQSNESNSSYDTQRVVQNGRSTLNCSCSRTLSGDNIPPIKTRNRNQARICSLS